MFWFFSPLHQKKYIPFLQRNHQAFWTRKNDDAEDDAAADAAAAADVSDTVTDCGDGGGSPCVDVGGHN